VHHPWTRICSAYASDAAAWIRPKKKLTQITDLDVYSFLVWRAATSYAAYDCTAGPKAIYFNWEPMPQEMRMNCLAADAIVASDSKDETVLDRYSHVIKINLTGVVDDLQGKIYRVEPANKNDWQEITLEGSICMKGRENLWKKFVAGGPFFQDVPHGCIVTPLGQIPTQYLEFESVPNTTTTTINNNNITPQNNNNNNANQNDDITNQNDIFINNDMEDDIYPWMFDGEEEEEEDDIVNNYKEDNNTTKNGEPCVDIDLTSDFVFM